MTSAAGTADAFSISRSDYGSEVAASAASACTKRCLPRPHSSRRRPQRRKRWQNLASSSCTSVRDKGHRASDRTLFGEPKPREGRVVFCTPTSLARPFSISSMQAVANTVLTLRVEESLASHAGFSSPGAPLSCRKSTRVLPECRHVLEHLRSRNPHCRRKRCQ